MAPLGSPVIVDRSLGLEPPPFQAIPDVDNMEVAVCTADVEIEGGDGRG
jgi:hypothetical protein